MQVFHPTDSSWKRNNVLEVGYHDVDVDVDLEKNETVVDDDAWSVEVFHCYRALIERMQIFAAKGPRDVELAAVGLA